MAHGCGTSAAAFVEVRDDALVQRVSEHLVELDAEAAIHGLLARERFGGFGAPPGEVVAAFTPTLTCELRDRRDDRPVLLLLVDSPKWELPAHFGLEVAVVFAGPHGVHVQRAPRAEVEVRPVEEDARVVDETSTPFLLAVLVLAALRVDALLARVAAELPF